jgi:hypothetical protein
VLEAVGGGWRVIVGIVLFVQRWSRWSEREDEDS